MFIHIMYIYVYVYIYIGNVTAVLPGSWFSAQLGYFENTVAGKITELRVAVFWATFIIYRGRPKCI